MKWLLIGVGLLVGAAFFLAGVVVGGRGYRGTPALLQNLTGGVQDVKAQFDRRIRERFPVGSSEEQLTAELRGADFHPAWEQKAGWRHASYDRPGLPCRTFAHVQWQAEAGRITAISGSYSRSCL